MYKQFEGILGQETGTSYSCVIILVFQLGTHTCSSQVRSQGGQWGQLPPLQFRTLHQHFTSQALDV